MNSTDKFLFLVMLLSGLLMAGVAYNDAHPHVKSKPVAVRDGSLIRNSAGEYAAFVQRNPVAARKQPQAAKRTFNIKEWPYSETKKVNLRKGKLSPAEKKLALN